MFSNVVHFSQIYLPKRSGVTLCKTRLLYTFTAYCFQILLRLVRDKSWERDEIYLGQHSRAGSDHNEMNHRAHRASEFYCSSSNISNITNISWKYYLKILVDIIREIFQKFYPGWLVMQYVDWNLPLWTLGLIFTVGTFCIFCPSGWYAGGEAGLEDTKH